MYSPQYKADLSKTQPSGHQGLHTPGYAPVTARELSERLGGKPGGKGFVARCPAHDDKHASLSISDGDNGKLLLYCHAGCKFNDVVQALGLPRERAEYGKRQVAVYQYRDSDGKLLSETVRYVLPDGSKTFAQRRDERHWSMAGVKQVPYRLPELVKAIAAGRTICHPEGEKDADNLVRLGFEATTNQGGANKPKIVEAIAPYFKGADVVVLPDNAPQPVSRQHAEFVASAYLRAGARRVRIATVPAPHKDVSDYIAAGATAADVQALIDASQDVDVAESGHTTTGDSATQATPWFVTKTLADLQNEPIPAQLTPEIQAASLSTIYGPSGAYKTFYVIDRQIMPVVLSGRKAWFVSAETNGRSLAARFNAYCAHHQVDPATFADRLRFFTVPVYLMQPDHVSQFIAAIKDFAPDMVVLDTLAVCELGGDENSTRDMTIMLDACRRIIRETGAAVVLVHHTGKNGTSERGASALRAQCDHMVELSAEDYGVKVTDSKQRDRACFDPYYLRPVQAGDSLVLLPSDKVVQTAADRLTPRQAQALEALALETFVEAGAKATQIAEVAHIPTDNIHRVLSALKRLGYVQQDVKGDPYRITEAGLSRLSSPSFYRHDGHDGWTPGSSVTVSHRHPPLGVTETTVTTDGVGKLLKTTETTVTSSETTVVSEPQATATVRSPQATKPSGRQRLPSNDSHDGDDSRSPGTLGKQITVPEIQWYASQVGVKYTYDMTGEALYKLYCAIPDRQRRAFEDYLPSDLAARLADYRQGQLRLLRKEVSRES